MKEMRQGTLDGRPYSVFPLSLQQNSHGETEYYYSSIKNEKFQRWDVKFA